MMERETVICMLRQSTHQLIAGSMVCPVWLAGLGRRAGPELRMVINQRLAV